MGQIAGNFALTCGSTDGIFIAGGIAQRYPSLLIHRRFRAGFESKGRHRELLEKTPTFLIRHPNPGLLGASFVARQLESIGGNQPLHTLTLSV